MKHAEHFNPDRLHELLADRALAGLDADQQRELDRMPAGAFDEHLAIEYELTAAALDEALRPEAIEPLPDAVRDRLQSEAVRWLAESRGLALTSGATGPGPAPRGRRSWSPWLAAAACLVLAALSWILMLPRESDPALMRATLLAQAPDAHTIAWADNDLGVTGDVVWSDHDQKGYLRFKGLQANIPSVEEYQLWIFDENRDDRFPVDGGVFDIPADGGAEIVIPIDPRLKVGHATLFAVTIEPPGGVVVSDRTRLILAAPLGN